MDEYIKREAAVAVCDEQYKECLRKSDFCGDTVAWNICADIKAIPAADVVPVVHGEWLLRHEGYGHYWECSSCHKNPCIYVTKDTRYCPNCGAKMDIEDGGDNDAKFM